MRLFAISKEEIQQKLMNVIPDQKTYDTFIKKIDSTDTKINIWVDLNKDYRKLKNLIENQLKYENIEVEVKLTPKATTTADTNNQKNLSGIKNIVAVYSCKGGVGKSTVAVNLAYNLSQYHGLKVGIFDADIQGPSLPTLVKNKDKLMQDNNNNIIPLETENVKLMSYGFTGSGKAVTRGPITSNIVSQLMYQTLWGDLDYLVIDMPPGTGDIHLTLAQQLKIDGAVIVTTPQKLSFIDVVKGIEMMDTLKVPTLAAVENMSYFECGTCTERHRIFGPGYKNYLIEQFGIQSVVEIPMLPDLSKYSDSGSPYTSILPAGHPHIDYFTQLGEFVKTECKKVKNTSNKIKVTYDASIPAFVVHKGEEQVKEISPRMLRLNCRCAACVDEMTNQPLINPDKIPVDVYPTHYEAKGNYAVAVVWSDGHRSSIYPYEKLIGWHFSEE